LHKGEKGRRSSSKHKAATYLTFSWAAAGIKSIKLPLPQYVRLGLKLAKTAIKPRSVAFPRDYQITRLPSGSTGVLLRSHGSE
jgi:hypothetical protein